MDLKLPILFSRTTHEQSIKMATKQCTNYDLKKSKQEFEVQYRQRGDLGRCSGLLVYDTFEAHVTDNVKVVFALRKFQFSSNSSQIDLSSLIHSVP